MKDIKILTGCVAVLTVIAVGFVLQAAQSVFLPLMIAWLLSYLMTPGIKYLTKLHFPIEVTTFILLAVFLLFLGQIGGFLTQVVIDSSDKYIEYANGLRKMIKHLQEAYPGLLSGLGGWKPDELLKPEVVKVYMPYLSNVSGFIINILSKTVMVFVFLMFILFGSPYVEAKMLAAFPKSNEQVLTILGSISKQIGRFITVMTAISASTGLFIWLGLNMIGVDMAATWGVLAFFLNYIPTVGSIVASIPPIVISLVQFQPDASAAMLGIAPQVLMTLGVILGVQVTIGNILMPKVMGDSMDLSPVVILISLLLWGLLWGVAGALLSMPIAGIIKIVCDNVEPLHMVGVLMSSGKRLEKSSA